MKHLFMEISLPDSFKHIVLSDKKNRNFTGSIYDFHLRAERGLFYLINDSFSVYHELIACFRRMECSCLIFYLLLNLMLCIMFWFFLFCYVDAD